MLLLGKRLILGSEYFCIFPQKNRNEYFDNLTKRPDNKKKNSPINKDKNNYQLTVIMKAFTYIKTRCIWFHRKEETNPDR